jgi:hypothetical protein
MGKFWLLIPMIWLFLDCAPGPKPMPINNSANQPAKPELDRMLGRLIAQGRFTAAKVMADSLVSSKDPASREIATYWKAIYWLNRDMPDSALVLLESYQGKWTGGLRRVHSESFLHLAKSVREIRFALRQANMDQSYKPAPDKALQDKVEILQREADALRAEVLDLETERLKYQKLINDLETIR